MREIEGCSEGCLAQRRMIFRTCPPSQISDLLRGLERSSVGFVIVGHVLRLIIKNGEEV